MSTRDPAGLSRRGFLSASGLGLLGLALPLRLGSPRRSSPDGQLGRVLVDSAQVFREPSTRSRQVWTLRRDEVRSLLAATVGGGDEPNRVWYEVERLGFVHSSAVQPVRAALNPTMRRIPYKGALAEVTLPFIEAYWEPSKQAEHAYRFYYASTHWVDGLTTDKKDRTWYRIYDDRIARHYYAMPEGLREIPVAELTPISPEIPAERKRIEVNLTEQWAKCYEGDTVVYTARVSTGTETKTESGEWWTPTGAFTTFRKRGSRHMLAGNLASGYDLPGVPWVSYITQEGISFHGTYWHNDFGTPRSHGCINMSPAAAKWVFRWTHPLVPRNLDDLWTEVGTRVRIFR